MSHRRFKISDVPSNVSKGAPDFCTVYVISKGKISSVRNASRSAPFTSPLHNHIMQIQAATHNSAASFDSRSRHSFSVKGLLFIRKYMNACPFYFLYCLFSNKRKYVCNVSGAAERTPRKPLDLIDNNESIK